MSEANAERTKGSRRAIIQEVYMLSITGINAGQAETYHWKGHEESYYEKEGDSKVLAGFDGKDQATFKDALDIVRERQEKNR